MTYAGGITVWSLRHRGTLFSNEERRKTNWVRLIEEKNKQWELQVLQLSKLEIFSRNLHPYVVNSVRAVTQCCCETDFSTVKRISAKYIPLKMATGASRFTVCKAMFFTAVVSVWILSVGNHRHRSRNMIIVPWSLNSIIFNIAKVKLLLFTMSIGRCTC